MNLKHEGMEKVCRQEIPHRLRKLRESQRPIKSMVLVSELCGLGSGAVRRYERGESKPTSDALIALADFYSVSTDYILGRTDDPRFFG